MVRAIIIDDEAKARRMMEALLREYCPDVEIVAIAEDVPSGVIAINQHNPDVLFLDVEMPGYTGFQLLDFFKQVDFEIIFTTAHSDYALQAFKVSAIDFLLKPIQISELISAVEKVKKKQGAISQRLDTLRENFKDASIRKLALSVSEGLIFIDISDILYLAADGAYTSFHLAGGQTILVSKKIKEYEGALNPDNHFFRPHRSYVINLNRVRQYVRQDGGYILMEDDAQIPLARERKEEFNLVIQKISFHG